MLDGLLSPVFLQEAGQSGNGKNKIKLLTSSSDVSATISCNGNIKIQSVENGEKKEESYSNLEDVYTTISCDKNTEIVIIGDVTKFAINDEDSSDGYLQTIDVSKCNSLLNLSITNCSYIENVDLSKNANLQELVLSGCVGLLDLSLVGLENLSYLEFDSGSDGNNAHITELDLSSCVSLKNATLTGLEVINKIKLNNSLEELYLTTPDSTLTKIYYAATNNVVSSTIADVIADATAADGTVYTDSEGAYYSTIADAATAKGWTIEQL